MKNILTELFDYYEFRSENLLDGAMFHTKTSQEYFITANYNTSDLTIFFESDKTNDIIKKFQEFQEVHKDIKKNTSLIIYIKTDNIEEFFKEYRNLIFKIEEDEYFFRKYVIVYSESGISNIQNQSNTKVAIQNTLRTKDRIVKFQEEYYKDEEFFIAIQLVIKIPFLVLENKTEDFESINNIIFEALEANKLTHSLRLIESFQESISTDEYYDELENAFLFEGEDNAMITDFFSQLEMNTDEN